MPEQFDALGLDTDTGGRQAIHKLQAWASTWELDAVREQDKEVAAMHNRAEQFDASAEALFIPFQVCCIVTDQGAPLGRPAWVVCVGQSKGCIAHQRRALWIPTSRLVLHDVSGKVKMTGRAAVCSAYLTDQMALV